MKYIIAVFKSRNETLYFANMFKKNGMFVSVINTPKEAGQACGISVKLDVRLLPFAKQFIQNAPFRAFSGFYSVSYTSNGQIIEKI